MTSVQRKIKCSPTVLLLVAAGISSLGDFVYLVALNLSVLHQTHSAAAVSALWAIPPLAGILIYFWSGSIVDRLDRKTVLITADLLRGLLVLSLPFLSSLFGVYLILFLLSGTEAFYRGAFSAYFTKLIPAEKRKRVNSLMAMMTTGAIVVGPAIAGAILAVSTPNAAFVLDGVSFLLSAFIFLFFMPTLAIEQENSATDSPKRIMGTIRADWLTVFRFAKQNRFFMIIFALVQMTFVIGSAVDSQEVVFAQHVLHLDSTGYSLLVTSAGVGYVLGAIFVVFFAKRVAISWLLGLSVFMAVGFMIFALSWVFWIAAIGMVMLGFFQSCSNTGYQTFYQNHVPIDKMARISGVFRIFLNSFIVLFTIGLGVFAQSFGVQLVVVCAVSVILVGDLVLLGMVSFPSKSEYIESNKSSFQG